MSDAYHGHDDPVPLHGLEGSDVLRLALLSLAAIIAAALAIGTKAGSMASSSGNDTAAPTPRNIVRRDSDFLVRNMLYLSFRFSAVLTGGASLFPADRIRNGVLWTTPRTIAERR